MVGDPYGGKKPAMPAIPVYEAAAEWSDWYTFERSSNLAAARYKLDRTCTWEVIFGGKPARPTKKDPAPVGVTAISCYSYGPDDRLTEALFLAWVNQYVVGGSAGIWFDLNVKRVVGPPKKLWTQGA